MKARTLLRAFIAMCLAGIFVVWAGPVGAKSDAKPPKPKPNVQVQILAINDFHGNLEPPAGSSGRIGTINAGGIEYLATHMKLLEATNPNTVIVSAGDVIGASPLLSGLFHDEPTIEGMNLLGLDLNAVGNHEFDEGVDELRRMHDGGCHPVDGCQDGDPFLGADFDFLAANVYQDRNGKRIFPPYRIKTFEGQKVAFIGEPLKGTPTIVTPSAVAGLRFEDEADTINALVPELEANGVEAIVAMIHEGGFPTGGFNDCPGISGPIVDIVQRLDPAVDVVITGHTHAAYNCVINGRPVTSASSFGRLITDYDLTIDPATHDVTNVLVDNKIVTRDVAKDPAETSLILKYKQFSDPIANRVSGKITADITRATNAASESALGDVIADAQLDATDDPGFGEAVAAFMNPGGIRSDLVYNQISGGEQPGEVTYGELFAVQPFGNSLVTMTLTGAQIDQTLEQQFDNPTVGATRILQISGGFTYTWDAAAPTGSKVSNIRLNGALIDPTASYRVTVNSFLADGGDGFTALRGGTNRLGGDVDVDAFEDYLGAHSPVAPGPQNRITRVN